MIAVTWRERNATSNISVMRISTDNGKTLRQILKLADSGTISGTGRPMPLSFVFLIVFQYDL